MKKLKINSKNTSGYLILTISIFCLFLIFYFSEAIKNSIIQSIFFCLTTIIPSLFPMLTVSFFILEIPIPDKLKLFTERITARLFGLSGNTLTTIITGLTGGYNVSCRNACKLLEKKQITENEAKRLATFFSSPGLSFCIGITGLAVYNSATVGLRLFLSGIAADFLIMCIYNLLFPLKKQLSCQESKTDISSSFVQAVSNSSSAIISISFWIILFSTIKALLSRITFSTSFTAFCELFCEVSSGVFFASNNYNLYVCAFCLFSGGFCVFLQQLPDLLYLKIKPLFFLSIKLLRSLSSVLILKASFLFFPSGIPVFNPAFSYRIFSSAPSGTLALLFLCFMFICSSKKCLPRTENSS